MPTSKLVPVGTPTDLSTAKRAMVSVSDVIETGIYEGNIGYQMPGRIPIRNANHSGLLPVPGWTDEFE